ncbi:unnamed protein product [Spirodela intermedia]|uniref:Uncharacterized protein n=1 Tax=Spirodela intermedia TaxID=51605 RepID=A0A7I8K406_SPIIN|nr:unnamed protein product [Spirodela intermedia]
MKKADTTIKHSFLVRFEWGGRLGQASNYLIVRY